MSDAERFTRDRSIKTSVLWRAAPGAARGQAVVEFALIAPVLMVLLLVGVQLAVIGDAALGLGQVDYQGARYAAINPSATQSAVQSYMVSAASPLIAANGGAYLTATLSPAPPCSFVSTVTVARSF